MPHRVHPLAAFVFLLLLKTPTSAESLAARLEEVTTAKPCQNAHWGILVVDADTGETVYALNPDQLFAPASTTKLFSVAAALDAFGADFRFQTPVHAKGVISKTGVLEGDLILVASGDITMGGRTDPDGKIAFANTDHTYASIDSKGELTKPDPLAGLHDLARQVRQSGIQRVSGNVLVDDRLFEKTESTGSGPKQVTPIIVNDSVIDLTISPSKLGDTATVDWRPQSLCLQVDPQIQTVEKGEPTRISIREISPGRLQLKGRIAEGRSPVLLIHEVKDPASFARSLFIESLRKAGVAVAASPFDDNDPHALPGFDRYSELPRVALLKSPPFSETAKLILKVSHNIGASALPLLLATRQGKRTLRDGLRLEADFLGGIGVDGSSISFGSGAGGSPADFTTPRATVQLLQGMSKHSQFQAYQNALPILGVDGTLAEAVDADSPVRGHAQGKTGTFYFANALNGEIILTSKALAGYLQAKSGRSLIFAMVVNNVRLKAPSDRVTIGKILGKLCEILYLEN
ncbi:MAG: D-alanyl-D-alanine carboxypeptidase/D-alanyl-D-alanine-endopeptidase [Planctomycetota bacterium]